MAEIDAHRPDARDDRSGPASGLRSDLAASASIRAASSCSRQTQAGEGALSAQPPASEAQILKIIIDGGREG